MSKIHRTATAGHSVNRFRLDRDGSIYTEEGGSVGQVKNGQFRRSADYSGPKWPVDLKKRIEDSASRYDLSTDPLHYIFDAGRANTATVPNDNHLAFPKEELLEYRSANGCRAYQTYVGAPHHMEHQTDNPADARGFVLDVDYYNKAAAATKCKACGRNSRRLLNRRKNQIQCLCGTPVKDEYIAALMAIDTLKDPAYASSVEKGELPFWSMGCGIGLIECSLDGHQSHTDAGVCRHIRGANLGRYWLIDDEGIRQVSAREADGLARVAGLQFVPEDFMELILDRDVDPTAPNARRIARSFEVARKFEFDDLSNVQVGGDRRATRTETLSARRQAASGRRTKMSQRTNKNSAHGATRKKRTAMRYTVVRVNDDPNQTYAADSLSAAVDLAMPEPGARAVFAEVDAPDGVSAVQAFDDVADVTPVPADMLSSGSERESDVVLQAPEDEAVVIQPPGLGMDLSNEVSPGPSGAETPKGMDDIQSPLDEMEALAPEDMGVNGAQPEDMGNQQGQPAQPAMPRQMSANFASSYADWQIRTASKAGVIRLMTPEGINAALFRTKMPNAAASVSAVSEADIRSSLSRVGLPATLERYAGIVAGDLKRLAMEGISDNYNSMNMPDKPIEGGSVHEGQVNTVKEAEESDIDPAKPIGEPEVGDAPASAKDGDPFKAKASKVEVEVESNGSNDDDDESEDDNEDEEEREAAGGCKVRSASVEPSLGIEAEPNDNNGEGASPGDSETPVNEPLKEMRKEATYTQTELDAIVAERVAAKVEEISARYRRAAKLRDDQTQVELQRREASAKESIKQAMIRGMNVEYRRVATNMSNECRVYDAIARVLSTESQVGTDMASGEPIVYDGLHLKMSRRLAHQLVRGPILEFVNHVIEKGDQSTDLDERLMLEREADLKQLRLPEVEFETQNEASTARTVRAKAALEAEELRDRLIRSASAGGANRVDHSYPIEQRRSRPAPTDLDAALDECMPGSSDFYRG